MDHFLPNTENRIWIVFSGRKTCKEDGSIGADPEKYDIKWLLTYTKRCHYSTYCVFYIYSPWKNSIMSQLKISDPCRWQDP